MTDEIKTLADVDRWYECEILKVRTASEGLSWNRFIKSPRDWIGGNRPDPNGLCGDATAFVVESYVDKLVPKTNDGFAIGVILWDGHISNHIAAIMLMTGKTDKQSYTMNKTHLIRQAPEPKSPAYTESEFMLLHVYDLYYKKPTMSAKAWWQERDSDMGGKVTLALYSDI